MHSNSRFKAQFNYHQQPRPSMMSPPANPFTLEHRRAFQLGYYLENVAQMNIPKVFAPPLEPHHTEVDNFCIKLKNQFRNDLLGTTEHIWAIKQKYSRQQVDYLDYWVIEYFNKLRTKLQLQDLEYARIRLRIGQRGELNYVLYGQRFWDWCVESQLYNDHTLRNYSILLYMLLCFCSRKMSKLHHSLGIALYSVNNRLKQSSFIPKSKFDFKIATYKKIHNFIKRKGKYTFEDGSLYYANTFPTFPFFKEFFQVELKRFLNSSGFDVQFEISYYRFQAKEGECFKWYITFEDDYHKELTFLVLAILTAREHFAVHYGILLDIDCLNSVLTLRFDSTFYVGCEHLKFASFQIVGRVSSEVYPNTWYIYKVFEFLSKLGYFGVFMGHLFYWAHQNSLLDGTLFADNLEFACMILFYLEQLTFEKDPFPTIKSLTEGYALFKWSEDLSQMWNDQHFMAKVNSDYFPGDARIENWIIFDFFEFYHNFDFSTYVICPYDGVARKKENYELEHYKLCRWICIEGVYPSMHPIPNERCTEEKMQQFKLLIGRMYLALKDRNQPEMFYIEALTNPEYFLNYKNPSDGYQVGDFETEFPALVSEDKEKSNDKELVSADLIESISDLVADLNVNEKITKLNQNKVETANDHNEISSEESGFEDDQSNSEQSIGNQTGSNEKDKSDEEEDKCRVM